MAAYLCFNKTIKTMVSGITPNGTKDDISVGILHSVGGYYVTNEGTKLKPNYHVWIPGVTHATCDSAYGDITLAVSRCNYLAKAKIKPE